ncbi:hypothetical protein ABMA28_009583 [Loxostege sticticalis]|uniref:CCHC-type domain-containing protein n=1 Tax=Loxostege sticticalis TaxID=481309 RepID=A0ABD0SAS3_LOXSC
MPPPCWKSPRQGSATGRRRPTGNRAPRPRPARWRARRSCLRRLRVPVQPPPLATMLASERRNRNSLPSKGSARSRKWKNGQLLTSRSPGKPKGSTGTVHPFSFWRARLCPSFRNDLQEALRQFGLEQRNFVRAVIAGLEDRLLPAKTVRPPLAADRKKAAKASAAPAAEPAAAEPMAAEPHKPSKGKGKGKKTKAATTKSVAAPSVPEPVAGPSGLANPGPSRHSLPPQEADLLLPSTTAANDWQTVEKRKKKKKAPAAQAAAPKPSASKLTGKGAKGKTAAKKTKQSLTPPKTAAVIVTISPEAAKRGETYQSVLERARASVVPAELGIPDIKCRQTMTGARMFEIPGVERDGKADLFAQRLQEAVAGVASVARPQKLAPLMLSEMDDSVTKAEVIAAAARIGGCAELSVKCGEIRTGRGGRRGVYVQLPVAAAKILLEKRRIPLGLSSAAVRILDQRPMRCFRCFGTGHTSALCPSVDRTGLCLRCGQADHKAATCKAKQLKCAVCTAGKAPAGHVMGGPKCNPPATRGRPQAQSTPTVATAEAQPEPAEGNGAMSE